MHHKGSIYRSDNIQSLLDQRYLNAQLESKVAVIGPPPFTREDRLKFEQAFSKIIKQL